MSPRGKATPNEAATPPDETTSPMEDPMTDAGTPPTNADNLDSPTVDSPTVQYPTYTSPTVTPSAPQNGDRRPRVGTIVWGLVLAAIGAGFLATAIGVHFDAELAFIVLVATAGVLLLVGSVATSRRRRS